MHQYILWLDKLCMSDLDQVGGKNASLGEMIGQLASAGVCVPGGFATTAHAFRQFLGQSGMDRRIEQRLANLDVDDVRALAGAGSEIRQWIARTPFQPDFEQAVAIAFNRMQQQYGEDLAVAVRSSATAEDLPEASFAGQQETFLNVRGLDAILARMHEVFASLYNDRAIAYRVHQGFEHRDVCLSTGIQQMVRSDLGASGVMFTLDTESGFRDVVFITSAWGLGETVVQGAVNPDEFYVHKPTLEAGRPAVIRKNLGSKATEMIYADAVSGHGVITREVEKDRQRQFSLDNDEAMELARQALIIEKHYGRAMDIEWAKDGNSGRMYIVQARPETVKSRGNGRVIERYRLKQTAAVITEGRSIGQRIGARKGQSARVDQRNGPSAQRRCSGDRHDRPGLGTDHETGRSDRH